MKSLSPQARAAIDNPHVEPIRLLTIVFDGGLTLRLCDRVWGAPGEECRFDGDLYEPLVISWGAIERGAIDPVSYEVEPGEAEVVLGNTVPVGGAERFTALFATHDPHYATAWIAEIYGSAVAAGDRVARFAGRIEDALDMATDRVTLVLSGIELDIANRFSHEIVTTSAFPSADPDDVGRMLGQGYGRLKRVPFRAVDAGNRTSLVTAIGAAATSVPLSDAAGFPSAGTVQIELEKITYMGISADTLTGCARGQGGTTAVSHDAGAAVSEVQSEYVYAWGHPIQAFEAVYVDRIRQSGNYTAFTGLAGDEHPSFPGRAVVAFNTMPALSKQINIDDQISVDQGSHQHGEFSYISLNPESIRSKTTPGTYGDYMERALGFAPDTMAFIYDSTVATFNFCSWKNPGGTPSRWRLGIVYYWPEGVTEGTIYGSFRASDGTIVSRLTVQTGQHTITNVVTAWESCPGVTWAEINNGYFTARGYSILSHMMLCAMWLDIEYTVQPSEATGVEKLGTVVLTGNSGADVVIGSEVAADIRGWQDDDIGTFTGTPFGLIERPEHICKHILIDRCGLAMDAIGAGYTDAGAFYAANGYRLAVAVLERPNTRELLNSIALQARSIEFWEAGVHNLVPVGGDVTAAKALAAPRIDQGQLMLRYTPRVDIVNRMSARYAREWSGYQEEIESDRSVVSAENTASMVKFGLLEGDQLSFPFIIDEDQAQDVLDWRLKERAFPRLEVEMACGYFAADLERGDAVTFDFAPGDALDRALLSLAKPSIDHFRILDMVDRQDNAILIQAVFSVSQFDLAATMAAATTTEASMLVLDFDVVGMMAGGSATSAVELIRLYEIIAALAGTTRTAAIELLDVGATFEMAAVMAGTSKTSGTILTITYELSAVMTGVSVTTGLVLKNTYALSAVMAGETAAGDVDLFNPQDIAVNAAMGGATQTNAVVLALFLDTFIFEVATSMPFPEVELPLLSSGTYNFVVYWGDGNQDTITSYYQPERTHSYASDGNYTITIAGLINGWSTNGTDIANKILDIKNWGSLQVGSAGGQFAGCYNMIVTATDVLDVSGVTNMSNMFSGAHLFNANLAAWDVSNVTTMAGMFGNAMQFNADLSGWNVSNVTSMNSMFSGASAFNADLGNWNVANVTNMSAMFNSANSFDADLSAWNVSNVISMTYMFRNITLSTVNYDALLIGWAQLPLNSGVSFDGGGSKYSAGAAAAARDVLVNTYGWTITDGGQL